MVRLRQRAALENGQFVQLPGHEAGTEIVNDLAQHLEADAAVAKLGRYAQSDHIAKRVAAANASALRRDRRREKSRPLPFLQPLNGNERELRSLFARKVGDYIHLGWPRCTSMPPAYGTKIHTYVQGPRRSAINARAI